MQQVDFTIQQKQERLNKVLADMANNVVVTQAEAKLETQKQALAALKKEQQDLEWQTEDIAGKSKAIEEKLYGGQVKNPKELMALQKELTSFKTQRAALDDKTLELMTRIEEANKNVSAAEGELSQTTAQFQEAQVRFKADQSHLESEIAKLDTQRKTMRPLVDPEILSLYDRLRPDKAGRAIARVEQGMCTGCRISLPMSVVQKVRLGHHLVQCPSCSRILV